MPRAFPQGMKQEIAFLKYRREVVGAWPESSRKTVFLTAIDSRIAASERHSQEIASAALRHAVSKD